MTRRRFIFTDRAAKKLYASPEFNGSSEEYAARGNCHDSCDLSAPDLLKMFQVNDQNSFLRACDEAQRHYHSVLPGHRSIPVIEAALDQLTELWADETIFIIDGQLVPAPFNWPGSINKLSEHLNATAKIMQALLAQSGIHHTCLLEYRQELKISNAELAIIQGYLNACRDEDYQNEDENITNTVEFPDGKQMDIKCCGVQDGPSWTEAVLFDQHGQQLAYTEVCEHYMGSWELEHDGIIYAVDVTTEGNMLSLHPTQIKMFSDPK